MLTDKKREGIISFVSTVSLYAAKKSLKPQSRTKNSITRNTFRHCRVRFCWTTFLETAVDDEALCNGIFEAPPRLQLEFGGLHTYTMTEALRGGGFSKMVLQNPHRICASVCQVTQEPLEASLSTLVFLILFTVVIFSEFVNCNAVVFVTLYARLINKRDACTYSVFCD